MNETYRSLHADSAIRNFTFHQMLGLSRHGSRTLLGEAVFESRTLPSNFK